MEVPSLSRGCEIAQFFVRHTGGKPIAPALSIKIHPIWTNVRQTVYPSQILEGLTKDEIRIL